jgi:uncharacterized protein (DUF885 family)
MSNWSKEDKVAFSKSEVMMEFEKRLLKVAEVLNSQINKVAQDAVDSNIEKVKTLNNELQKAKTTLESMNHDGFLENYLDADLVEGTQETSEEEKEELLEASDEPAQEELINDLEAVAQKAISEGHYKIAYDIERTIREILDGE